MFGIKPVDFIKIKKDNLKKEIEKICKDPEMVEIIFNAYMLLDVITRREDGIHKK
jgi:hypothetical protein